MRFIEMNLMKKTITILIITLGILSCKEKLEFSKKKAEDEKIIVQYGEHFLTDRDIRLILP